MQEEAIKRVREMQKRSRSYVAPDISPQQNTVPESREQPHKPSVGQGGAAKGLLGSLLGGVSGQHSNSSGELFNIAGISIDEEKALIGLLIYILYKQGADVKLLLALGYLLL